MEIENILYIMQNLKNVKMSVSYFNDKRCSKNTLSKFLEVK